MKNIIVIITAILVVAGTICSVIGISIMVDIQNDQLDMMKHPEKYESYDDDDVIDIYEKNRDSLVWIDIGMALFGFGFAFFIIGFYKKPEPEQPSPTLSHERSYATRQYRYPPPRY